MSISNNSKMSRAQPPAEKDLPVQAQKLMEGQSPPVQQESKDSSNQEAFKEKSSLIRSAEVGDMLSLVLQLDVCRVPFDTVKTNRWAGGKAFSTRVIGRASEIREERTPRNRQLFTET